jgi:hypothetical protein
MDSLSDFFPLPFNSTAPSNRAIGFPSKPQVVGEQNESESPNQKRQHSVEPVLIRPFGRVGAVPNRINPNKSTDGPLASPAFLVVEEGW